MRRVRFAAAGAMTGALLLGASTVHAEVVQTPAGSVSSVQLSLAIDNDWQFRDGQCLLIPVVATYGRADDTSIIGELSVTKPSDPTIRNDGTFLVLPGDPVSGQVLDEVFVCPADGTGEYRLESVIRAIEPDSEQAFSLDPLTFWVRPASSRITELSALNVKGGTRIMGVARAGEFDATGIVEIQAKRPGTSRWDFVALSPVEAGAFSAEVGVTLPRGTRVRATLTRCSWCSRTSSTLRVA